jgi:hypothetical protein
LTSLFALSITTNHHLPQLIVASTLYSHQQSDFKMHLKSTALFSLASATSAFNLPSPQHIFSNPDSTKDFNIPTVHESAVQARRILQLESIGTLSTVFPSTPHSLERRPEDVGGAPIGLMYDHTPYIYTKPTPTEFF